MSLPLRHRPALTDRNYADWGQGRISGAVALGIDPGNVLGYVVGVINGGLSQAGLGCGGVIAYHVYVGFSFQMIAHHHAAALGELEVFTIGIIERIDGGASGPDDRARL